MQEWCTIVSQKRGWLSGVSHLGRLEIIVKLAQHCSALLCAQPQCSTSSRSRINQISDPWSAVCVLVMGVVVWAEGDGNSTTRFVKRMVRRATSKLRQESAGTMKDKSKLRSVPKCTQSGHQPQQTMTAERWERGEADRRSRQNLGEVERVVGRL